MKPEDELIDALLKEQARERQADEELLTAIDTAIDQEPAGDRGASRWRRALPLSIAAGIAIGGAVIHHYNRDITPALAIHEEEARVEREVTTSPVGDLLPGEMTSVPEPPAPAPVIEAPPAEEAGSDIAPSEPMEQRDGRESNAAAESLAADPAADAEVAKAAGAEPALEGAGGGGALDGVLGGDITSRNKVLRREAEETPGASMDAAPAPMEPRGAHFGRAPVPTRGIRPHPMPRPEPEPQADLSRENYGQLTDQPWKSPWDDPLSTFSIDVDTASYTNVRRMIREGRTIQPDAVRIEELVNYFDYNYPQPEGDNPFAVTSTLATCPWQPKHLLARVAIKGREIENNARPASNLVFLIDVSGSMQSSDKLPMLKRAMATLIDSLDERDRVGIVVYAGSEGVVLSPTELNEKGKSKALRQIGKLESGGSTNGGAGLYRAYQMALKHMVDGGVNRVILATDGDFNVGNTGEGSLVELVAKNAAKGVSLSVLGFGTGNLNDSMLEAISNDGNGNYFYVDGDREAKRIFLQKLSGTLVTIAKDVKIQVEFNPGKVKAYRLIGYSNRVLRHQDFNNDKVDAGDIGAGHTVTAFYEIVPVGVDSPDVGDVDELKYQRPAERCEVVDSNDWFTLKLRYKHPEGDKSRLITTPVVGDPVKWKKAGPDFRMAAAVALFGMKLRGMDEVEDIGWDRVEEIAKPALADDPEEQRAEFLELVREM